MTKRDIVSALAVEQRVERIVSNIAHEALTPELKDLAQMIYLVLLEYDDAKIEGLWENEQINFFIARVCTNQFKSSNSPYHNYFRKYQQRSIDLCGIDIEDK